MAAIRDSPPGPLLRTFFKAPVVLYRAHLGWLLGSRFLCLMHRGRRSGQLRRTVVEVVHFDHETQEVAVVAGWGPHTQWYLNLEAAPPEEVRVGRRRWRAPRQRFLDEDERVTLLQGYVRDHPRAAKGLARAYGITSLDAEGTAGLAGRVRAVAFRPSDDR
jgi:deazaflavin-dependent oxidoreductase (nitroreductase family)